MPRLTPRLAAFSLLSAACLLSGFQTRAGEAATDVPIQKAVDDTSLDAAARIAAGRQEIESLQRTGRSHGKRTADVAWVLADLLGDLNDGHEAEHHEEAIADYILALGYYTKAKAPKDWADLKNSLAAEYRARSPGSKRRNIEVSVDAYRAALTVYTRSRFPDDWAMVQNNLCIILPEWRSDSRRDNVAAAISACKLALTVWTRDAAPAAFADTSENLALAIGAREGNSKRERLDAQIAAYEDAVGALSNLRDQAELPGLRRSLGLLYAKRGEDLGGGEADLDRAIASLTTALSAHEPGLNDFDHAHAQQELGRAYEARLRGDRATDVERALSAYNEALETITRTRDRDVWVSLQIDVGNALQKRLVGDAAENIEAAIAAYRNALSATSPRSDPTGWAAIQNDLGTALDHRIKGERTRNLKQAVIAYNKVLRIGREASTPSDRGDYFDNLGVAYGHLAENEPEYAERALRCFRRALSIKERGSLSWGSTQNNMGTVLLRGQRGGAATNIEAALTAFREALKSRTRGRDPFGWAQSMDNFGTALMLRVRGNGADNLEQAIRAYEDALGVRTRNASPREWAATQNNLAQALVDRIRGNRGDNVERAIQAYLASLTIYTEQSDPIGWSAIESNLGNAYLALDRGNRSRNVDLAIKAFDAALRVRTRETLPLLWAGTMNDRAIAYGKRAGPNRHKDLDQAIADHEASLTVWTKAAAPVDWAKAWNNLGAMFDDDDYRDRAAGIERAIQCYRKALTIRTRESLPADWANTQNNLAQVFMSRIQGDRSANVEEAIRRFRAALTVRTREALPFEFVATQKALARAYASRSQGDERENGLMARRAYVEAMDTVDDLVNDGLDTRQTLIAMKAAGELFRSAALLAARQGRLADALATAERGRARTLQLALRLDGEEAQVPTNSRKRLGELRNSLREVAAELDHTPAKPDSRVDDPVSFAASQEELRSKAAALRAEIATILPRRRVPDPTGVLPREGAVVVPLVAPEGAMLLILTAKGLSSLNLPEFNDNRMRTMFYGPSGRFGDGGWSKGYQAISRQSGAASPTQDWATAMTSFQRDAWLAMIGPLAKELDQLGIEHGAKVVLMTQDYLARMPLWLAKDPNSGQLFGERYRITSTPSLASLQVPSRTSERSTAAWFNDTAVPTLELTSLARQLFTTRSGAITLVDDASSRTSEALIKSLERSTNWFLWTHGRFDRDDPRASALQLAKDESGKTSPELSVGELLDARFEGRAPDLVILSACESGLADVSKDDELLGLPIALLQAGARGVISALWPVREDATALLMAEFADLSRDGKVAPSEALRLAAKWLSTATADDLIDFINQRHPDMPAGSPAAKGYERIMEALEQTDVTERPFANPYFWGAFGLLGTE